MNSADFKTSRSLLNELIIFFVCTYCTVAVYACCRLDVLMNLMYVSVACTFPNNL